MVKLEFLIKSLVCGVPAGLLVGMIYFLGWPLALDTIVSGEWVMLFLIVVLCGVLLFGYCYHAIQLWRMPAREKSVNQQTQSQLIQ